MSLQIDYKTKIIPRLAKEYGYKNSMAVPRVVKVVVHAGVGKMSKDQKMVDAVLATIARITGQKPVPTLAKKSIAAFKTRKGMVIGYLVTLRGARMYDFLEKMIRVTFPRVRDFRGIPLTSVDGHGNLSVGFREHIAFPEVDPDEVERVHGLQVVVATNAHTRAEGIALLKALGIPFRIV